MGEDSEAPTALVTEETRPPGSSRTFVFVHGLGVSSWYFDPLLEEIGEDVPTLLLDLPGFGRASEPEATLCIEGLAESLIRTLAELELDDVVLVGHSMGAQVVVEAIAQHPTLARAVVLLTPVVTPEDRRALRVIQQFARASIHETWAAFYRSVLTFLSTNPLWIAKHFRAMVDYRLEDRIGEIPAGVPLLLMRGSYDHISSRGFLRLLQVNTQHHRDGGCAIVRELRGGSHHVMGTHAQAVAATILAFGSEV